MHSTQIIFPFCSKFLIFTAYWHLLCWFWYRELGDNVRFFCLVYLILGLWGDEADSWCRSECHLCYASNLLDFAHFPFYFWHVWYPHVWILCFKKLNFITSDLNKKYRNEPCVLTVPTSWNLVAKCTTAVTYVKQSNLTFLSVSESSDSMRYETYCFWAFGVYFLFLEWYLWWSEIFVPNE